MELQNKAKRIQLFDLSTPQMRAFHMSWFAFFLCFFAWFGIAALMPIIRDEMSLTKDQIGWCMIGGVAITVFARLFIGWFCDRVGPRIAYTLLLLIASIPVMGVGLARDFQTLLIFQTAIGAIGAAFVITQYHTSVMFAPTCLGTANATTAGWGNLGGGVTQAAMPALATLFGVFGLSAAFGWRASMVVAGLLCAATGIAYYLLTQDAPDGNFSDLRKRGLMPSKKASKGTFLIACSDYRVWALFLIYGACFGIELIFNSWAALYFTDCFDLGTISAGTAAGLYGTMNLFSRTLGGYCSDRFSQTGGLSGRVRFLFISLFLQGLAIVVFSRMTLLPLALGMLLVSGVLVQMSSGATFSIVPFINKKAMGSVAGIVGAGGNVIAIAAAFLFKTDAIAWPTAFLILGVLVTGCSFLCFTLRFSRSIEPDTKTASEVATQQSEPAPELAGV